MSELTLEACGFHDDEARVARQAHRLTHESDPPPAWLAQHAPWCAVVVDPAMPHQPEGETP